MDKFTADERIILREFRQAQKYIRENDIKSVTETPQGDIIIPVKAVVFNSPGISEDKFQKSTDFGHPAATGILPAYFHHGKDKGMISSELMSLGVDEDIAFELADEMGLGKKYIGAAVRSGIDDEALFYNIIVSRRAKYKNAIRLLAEEGHIDTSSAAAFRENDPDDEKSIRGWHMKEITLTPTPDEPKATVLNALNQDQEKSLMADENLEEKKEEGGEQKKSLKEIIDEKLDEPTETEEPAQAVAEGSVEKSVSDLFGDLNKSINARMDELLTKMDTLNALEKSVQEMQDVMPYLIDKVAEKIEAAKLKTAERSKMSGAERETEAALQKKAPPLKTGYGAFPKNAPGSTRN
jgi:hypothetical protein